MKDKAIHNLVKATRLNAISPKEGLNREEAAASPPQEGKDIKK